MRTMKKTMIWILLSVMIVSITATATNEKVKEPLDKITFIHYKDGTAKIAGNTAKGAACYKLMGVKWNTLPVNYAINPTNGDGLPEGFVTEAISTAAETWDYATSAEIFNDAYSVNYTAQYGIQNYQNAIAFGYNLDTNVIAVTSIWYTRVGKRIVEFDMLFNDQYAWGDATTNTAAMDLQNIATHELGHGVGLGDIYSSACSTVTMYGYSNYGETSKRTLETPDITGLQKMYGA
ncbi:MAG: matrixin family metalloprotease [archaeon]